MFNRILSMGACGVLLLASAAAMAQDFVDFPPGDTAIWPSLITVSGQGEVKARPEQATLRFGVEAQEQQAADAQSAVNQAMQRVIQSVKELQVPDRAIQTAGLNLSPVYSPRRPGQEQETPKIEAYRASNTLQLRVTDLTALGDIVDAAIQAGANRLEGITFELNDETPHKVRALKLASREAATKARALAEAFDVPLGPIYKIQAGSMTLERPQMHFGVARMEAAGGAMASTPVQPGDLTVTATVTVQYEIPTPRAQSGLGGTDE